MGWRRTLSPQPSGCQGWGGDRILSTHRTSSLLNSLRRKEKGKTPLLAVIGALLPLSVGCSGRIAAADPGQTLLNALEDRQRAVSQGDVETIFSFWTDDIVIYPVSEPAVTGIAAVRDYVRRHRQELGLRPRITPLQVVASQSADLGYIVGTYDWVDREGQATRPGRYVALWRTDAQGAWKCFLEIHSPRPVESP